MHILKRLFQNTERGRASIYFTDYYLPVTSVTQYPFEAED